MIPRAALKALSSSKPYEQARSRCPASPGLYAFYAGKRSWRVLRLSGHDGRALYVGKSERSLVARDLDGHFFAEPDWGGRKTSPTGHSTLRRSIAALLGFEAMPRNPLKVEARYAPMFGLRPQDDVKLGKWMRAHLQLAVWSSEGPATLKSVEGELKSAWQPPLNLDVDTRWKEFVRTEREKLTAQAKRY